MKQVIKWYWFKTLPSLNDAPANEWEWTICLVTAVRVSRDWGIWNLHMQ